MKLDRAYLLSRIADNVEHIPDVSVSQTRTGLQIDAGTWEAAEALFERLQPREGDVVYYGRQRYVVNQIVSEPHAKKLREGKPFWTAKEVFEDAALPRLYAQVVDEDGETHICRRAHLRMKEMSW